MDTRTCPFCAEYIQGAAVKCKHCGSPLANPPMQIAAPQTRRAFKIVGCMILATLFIVLLLSAFSDGDAGKRTGAAPSQTSEQGSTADDADRLKALRSELTDIEEEFTTQSQGLKNLTDGIATGATTSMSARRKATFNRDFTTHMSGIAEALQKASLVQVPVMQSKELSEYVRSTVEAHKQWALFQQAKFNALFNDQPNLDLAKQFADSADQAADREGASLILAYRAAGLDSK